MSAFERMLKWHLVSYRMSVCLSVPSIDCARRAAGLLLSAVRVGDIDRQLRRAAGAYQQLRPGRCTAGAQQQTRAVSHLQLTYEAEHRITVIFTEDDFLSWWKSSTNCRVISKSQCFDAVGWAAGRASRL